MNTSYKLSNHGKFLLCSIFLFWMTLPFNLALWQVHYLKNRNTTEHECILFSKKGFNDCSMRVREEAQLCIEFYTWATETMYMLGQLLKADLTLMLGNGPRSKGNIWVKLDLTIQVVLYTKTDGLCALVTCILTINTTVLIIDHQAHQGGLKREDKESMGEHLTNT